MKRTTKFLFFILFLFYFRKSEILNLKNHDYINYHYYDSSELANNRYLSLSLQSNKKILNSFKNFIINLKKFLLKRGKDS